MMMMMNSSKQHLLLLLGRNPYSRLFSTQYKGASSNTPIKVAGIRESIKKLNDQAKQKHLDSKDDKVYISKMSPERIEKIGSATLLDKQWADKPLNIVRNPHKLTEVELYRTLEKIVELPEKRLRQMLTIGNNAVDEVFLANIIQRIPQFLTTTLVNITKTLMLQKDYFRDHPIWKPLEKELYRRKNNLNNEQLASVIHAFGVTGNGSKEFYYDLEETVVDSPIPIENEHLEKILQGYSQIDQGTAVFYSHIVERILHRGLDQLTIDRIVEVAKNLKRATNVQAAGFGYYEALEKHIHRELHQNKLSFSDLCAVAENVLANNIGSNQFQEEIEKFLLSNYSAENLQHITDLIKGLSQYKIKTEELEIKIFQTLHLHMDEFTLKQLETLIWSMARYIKSQGKTTTEIPQTYQIVLNQLVEKVRLKTASMKPRGVAFAIESIASLDFKNEETFKKLEKVVISKLDDFIPHYMVKVLAAYYKMGYGSGELYDKLISGVIKAMNEGDVGENLKYSDMLRFFEIFPEVSYIFESTMNEELYKVFVAKISHVMKDKKFPTEDVSRVFSILVRLSPYQPQFKNTKDAEPHQRFMAELIGRLRHSIYDIPKEYFSLTLANLLEFQQPEIAGKFVYILQEVNKQGKLQEEFSDVKDRIRLFWSLMQLEKACQDPTLINQDNLKFLAEVKPEDLDPRHFLLYKQLVCLAKLWFDGNPPKEELLNFNEIYQKFATEISQGKREDFINEDPATKTNQNAVTEIVKIVKQSGNFTEVNKNLSDDLMNLIDIACGIQNKATEAPQLVGILLMNRHHYIQTPFNDGGQDDALLRRTVELKHDILDQLFGWTIAMIDEQEYLKTPAADKQAYINQRLGITQSKQVSTTSETSQQQDANGGRKVKKTASQKAKKYD